MMYELRWSKESVRELQSLDLATANRITRKVAWFSKQEQPRFYAQPLSGAYEGMYRFRVGEYRVLFEISTSGQLSILFILRVKHRREAYR